MALPPGHVGGPFGRGCADEGGSLEGLLVESDTQGEELGTDLVGAGAPIPDEEMVPREGESRTLALQVVPDVVGDVKTWGNERRVAVQFVDCPEPGADEGADLSVGLTPWLSSKEPGPWFEEEPENPLGAGAGFPGCSEGAATQYPDDALITAL